MACVDCRQMEGLGSKVDNITSTLHASQTSSKQNDAILEHLSSLQSGLKDLQKSVQLVSERQEVAEASSAVIQTSSPAEKKAADLPKATPAPESKVPLRPPVGWWQMQDIRDWSLTASSMSLIKCFSVTISVVNGF